MQLNSSQILASSIIWVLVADGKEAQLYRYHTYKKIVPTHDEKAQHQLTPVPGMHMTAEPLSDFHVGRDDRGSFVGGVNAAHNTCEPHLDIHDEIKANLVAEIVMKLKRASLDKSFDYLVISASPKTLGALRKQMDSGIRSQVIAEIPKDFTNDKGPALLAHLQETLSEAHAA